MSFYDIQILPGNLSVVKSDPSHGGVDYTRLSDRQPVQYVNGNVDAAIYPSLVTDYNQITTGTTIGPFTTTTHRAANSAKMSPVVINGVTCSFSVTPSVHDFYLHVVVSGHLNLLAADASNYPAWGIRPAIVHGGSTIPIGRDDEFFVVVTAVNFTGIMPISGYRIYQVAPGTTYLFTLVAGYYGSVLPTQSLQPYATASRPFRMQAWLGG